MDPGDSVEDVEDVDIILDVRRVIHSFEGFDVDAAEIIRIGV